MFKIFTYLLKTKTFKRYSGKTNPGAVFAERFRKTKGIFPKKLVFPAGNASWLSEHPSVIKKYFNTIHSFTKMTLVQTSNKKNAEVTFNNLKDKRKLI